jgi:histidinol-phosphate aminotransferase
MRALHGGPDAQGVPRWDFSTNANACGPCPLALAAVQNADPRQYPDPAYTDLRARLAGYHGVATERIVFAASASEFVSRLSAALAKVGTGRVWLPDLAYGDYARAAQAWGWQRTDQAGSADLLWLCEPASPVGGAEPQAAAVAAMAGQAVVVLDRAYEALRLSGRCSLDAVAMDTVWQLWSPNKALGMTGVRGAYAIAPLQGRPLSERLNGLAPSWPLGAHAVAMLAAWARPEVQAWVAGCRPRLAEWKAAQMAMLSRMGWHCLPSEANYFCARPPVALDERALRAQGVKLRETGSLGLAGHWRLSAQPPEAQAALRQAWLAQQENSR